MSDVITGIVVAIPILLIYSVAYLHGHWDGVRETEVRWDEAVKKAEAHRRDRE